MGVGDLFQKLLDNLKACWPIRVIEANQQGVLFSRGQLPVLITPRVKWFWPGVQRLEIAECAYQEVDCGLQSMESQDGVAVAFSVNVGYTITNAAQVAMAFYNFDTTIRNMSRGHMAMAVHGAKYDDLQGRLMEIVSAMRKELRHTVSGRGVSIKSVRLDEFVRSPQLRLLGGITQIA